MNSKNIATMASQFFLTSDVCDAFLLSKMDINSETINNIKIINLKITKNLGMISKDKFKT
jgi:hypothetical protein